MKTTGRTTMIKHILTYLSLSLTLMTLAACGEGGGGGGGTTVYKTATVKIGLDGTLPANTAISGVLFTMELPADVTPAMTSGAVANGVATPSGTFTGGILIPPIYLPATSTTAGSLKIAMGNLNPSGITLVGEVVTVTLQLTNGASPAATSFNLNTIGVIDTSGNPISGVKAVISGLQLH